MKAQDRSTEGGHRRGRRFPWLLLIMLLASVYVFWILPNQLDTNRVRVEFAPPAGGSEGAARR